MFLLMMIYSFNSLFKPGINKPKYVHKLYRTQSKYRFLPLLTIYETINIHMNTFFPFLTGIKERIKICEYTPVRGCLIHAVCCRYH